VQPITVLHMLLTHLQCATMVQPEHDVDTTVAMLLPMHCMCAHTVPRPLSFLFY
jgi:hypothetical protein